MVFIVASAPVSKPSPAQPVYLPKGRCPLSALRRLQVALLVAVCFVSVRPLHAAQQWQLVGEAQLQVFIFNIYRSRLYTYDGNYKQGQTPVRLEITYQRDIPSHKLVQHTVEQWQHLGVAAGNSRHWAESLQAIWPNISKNDTLTFTLNETDEGIFTYNGQPLKPILDKNFGAAFLDIWLSPNTSGQDHRRQLIGKQ